LKEVDEQNWEYAHRLFQCVAAASRPLRADELAGFLAFDFEAGPIPTFLADWLPEDPTHTVLSTCSSLLAVVIVNDSPVLQFAHFSVKEYLTSARLAKERDTISRFHVSMTPAHTIVAQACLGILLDVDENITRDGLEDFPLVKYAAENWVGHARFENVSSNVQDGMKSLFDPSKDHLSTWVSIYDPEYPQRRLGSERPANSRVTPLHYAASCGLHDVAMFLIVEHSQDVNARGFEDEKTPLHVALSHSHVHVAQVLLEHGADTKAEDGKKRNPLHLASENGLVEIARFILERGIDTEAREDTDDMTPLEWASAEGHLEVVQLLLEHGADAKAQDEKKITPMHIASRRRHLGVARVLLEHGADVKAQDEDNQTPLHWAEGKEVTRFLLEHGADANALDIENRTPLHIASEYGHVGVVRVLLEHGVDANARDVHNMTPTHLASDSEYDEEERLDVVRLLLQYGSDIHALDNKGHTPFMIATEEGNRRIMQFLLENGAADHRK
jgi:ankyrin repeat protein